MDLEDLKEEVSAELNEPIQQEEQTPKPDYSAMRAGLLQSAGISTKFFGNIACKKMNADLLNDEEISALSNSIISVLEFYLPQEANEKTIAWANLSIITLGVFGTRYQQKIERAKQEKSENVETKKR